MILSRRTGAQRALAGSAILSLVTFLGACAATANDAPDDAVGVDTNASSALYRRGNRRQPVTATPAPTTTTTASPAPTTPATPPKLAYRGVNLSGAEFGSNYPGTDGIDYTFPTNGEVDYFMSKGMNVFRLNFQWERLQPSAYGEFATTYAGKLGSLVDYATSKGARVLLNPQNFARYWGNTIGSSQVPNAVFADFWRRLALRFESNPRVLFGLVNEPYDLATEQWVAAANAAIRAIRDAGSTNTVLVPGNAWTGAHSWADNWYGTPNAVAMLNVVDPANNVVFEAHQYLDDSSGGQSSNCSSTTAGRQRLQPFVSWLRTNGKKGFIAEFAGGNNATCNAAVTDMLNAMEEASDVLNGWIWWAGGPWWGEYAFSLEPRNGQDAPQMTLLAPRLANLPLF